MLTSAPPALLRCSLRDADEGTVHALESATREAEEMRTEVAALREKLQVGFCGSGGLRA